MKNKSYIVTFRTGITERVTANSEEQAKILAQARQIQAGNQYDIRKIEEVDSIFD